MKNLIFFGVFFIFNTSLALDLTTVAEKTGWTKTGRADETQRLCRDFAKQFPARVSCNSYGTTPQGYTLWYLTIQDVKPKKAAPTVWVQAGIHAGEIDGKDATFLLIKDALSGKMPSDPFKGLKMIFVPIVNVDGHERFGKWNRPNQTGPEEMGWRTTAQNYNLNRDFAKVEASETRDLNNLWNKMDPIVSLDLHVTDGAKFRPEVGIIVTPNDSHGHSPLNKIGQEFENKILDKMKSRGRAALPFYPSFEIDDDPLSGFARYVSPPRFANGYWYVRNRLGVLVESHSWKDYATRVKVHYDTVLSTLEVVQKNGDRWTKIAQETDRASLANRNVDLAFKHNDKSKTIDFEGFKYVKEKSKISGDTIIRYFDDKPEIWRVPFYEFILPTQTALAPTLGYFIPSSEFAWMKQKLDTHAIKYHLWKKALPEKVNVFRASKAELSAGSFEGRQTLTVEGKWQLESVQWPKTVYFVPINQASALIAIHLFEPMGPDSFLSWGFVNRFFELKEYMEDYVTEDVAKEMLAKNPEIQKEFDAMLKDQTFAKDPKKRFQFFHQKHPSWDDQYNRYPIYKL